MLQTRAIIDSIEGVGPDIYILRIFAPQIASIVRPGQFVNIKVHDFYQPFLRRPFSVSRVVGEIIEILFNVIGAGTAIMHSKRRGDPIDLIGPLGHPFNTADPFETALLVAGGMGVAPLPFLTAVLRERANIVTFIGARSSDYLLSRHLEHYHEATDNGTRGYRGTVVNLMREVLHRESYPTPKIFACGPQPMLKAVSQLALDFDIPCEISLESAMACGFGICQGCPVENAGENKKYSLICKDGPVFNSRSVILP